MCVCVFVLISFVCVGVCFLCVCFLCAKNYNFIKNSPLKTKYPSYSPFFFPLSLLQIVQERAGGNPLFARELCRTLQEDDAVARDDKSSATTCFARIRASLPSSLEGLITSRIDRLQPAEGLTLKVGG